ncbi:MAG TPA: RNA polymerase sigma-70 factor [Gammaproteobacteria bacterium]|jgi:RNA polymerase sigma-70 factor (ECF subfamily)|nr:RNA polymerase sigma-70 factor [Gammaproteobacteria bacterium]
MPASETTFLSHRPRLFGLAYRMLGSRSDAEDVLQDAWLRWRTADEAGLMDPEAWLVTVVTRLSIDRLRAAKREREAYQGPWLPEPLVAEAEAPERAVELAGDVSQAFLLVLERLAPEERAAFLLREVFDADYREVAQMLGRSEAACRQLLHRARERVRAERPRFQVNPEAQRRLLERFMAALQADSREEMLAVLAPEAAFTADGGGKVPAALRVLHGAGRIAHLFSSLNQRFSGRFSYREALINGEPGVLRFLDGRLDSTLGFVTDGERILDIYIVRNPDKLQHITVA